MSHHIDTIHFVPKAIDFDTLASGPEVSCLPVIVVYQGFDPVGHGVCLGVKYLQVAAALAVLPRNRVQLGP